MVQAPPEQSGEPFVASQILPHPPQLFGSLVMVTSQPSLGVPLQLPWTESQSMAQTPLRQAGVPPRLLQTLPAPHPPQCATSVVVFTSQPSVGLLLQSA